MATKIKRGDAYSLPVSISNDGEAINIADISSVEFCIGDNIRKMYPSEVTYNSTDGYFYIPLTQAETFSLDGGSAVTLDIRTKFTGGNVEGITKPIMITVLDSISEVEL